MFLEDAPWNKNKEDIKEIINGSSNQVNKHQMDSLNKLGTEKDHMNTGIMSLDMELLGIQPGDIMLLASRFRDERNLVVLNIIEHIIRWERVSTVYFCNNEPKKKILASLMSLESLVGLEQILTGEVNCLDYDRVKDAAYRLCDLPLVIDDDPDQSIHGIMNRTRKYRSECNVSFIVIDYISLSELVKIESSCGGEGYERVCYKMKSMAQEMNCAILILTDIPSQPRNDRKSRPSFRDLKNASPIFGCMDFILFAYCDTYQQFEITNHVGDSMQIIVTKTREGQSNKVVKLGIDAQRLRLMEIEVPEDVPFDDGDFYIFDDDSIVD